MMSKSRSVNVILRNSIGELVR